MAVRTRNALTSTNNLILSDHCSGRPVYEWRVPFGLDEAFAIGYNSIATTIENYANMERDYYWNENTQHQICMIDSNNASGMISQWSPQTVVIQCGTERLLTQMKSAIYKLR